MSNKYLSFVSDEHLMFCIDNLHKAYEKAKAKVSKKSFYANKIDTLKLTFDSHFNSISEEDLIKVELFRQIDKSINNSIGTFHEQVLGGITGFEMGKNSGFDIKASDNSLFADIKNKHNTMNSSSSEALFQKLARLADDNKGASCYWVQILAKNSFNQHWVGDINGKEYSHTRVFKISGDQFYALLSGEDDAFFKLYKQLPIAIKDYLSTTKSKPQTYKDPYLEISKEMKESNRSIIDQITFENFGYYLGFNDL